MRPPLPAVVALAVLPAAAALAIGRRGALFGGAALAAARAPRARAADAEADPSFSRAPSGLQYKQVKPHTFHSKLINRATQVVAEEATEHSQERSSI